MEKSEENEGLKKQIAESYSARLLERVDKKELSKVIEANLMWEDLVTAQIEGELKSLLVSLNVSQTTRLQIITEVRNHVSKQKDKDEVKDLGNTSSRDRNNNTRLATRTTLDPSRYETAQISNLIQQLQNLCNPMVFSEIDREALTLYFLTSDRCDPCNVAIDQFLKRFGPIDQSLNKLKSFWLNFATTFEQSCPESKSYPKSSFFCRYSRTKEGTFVVEWKTESGERKCFGGVENNTDGEGVWFIETGSVTLCKNWTQVKNILHKLLSRCNLSPLPPPSAHNAILVWDLKKHMSETLQSTACSPSQLDDGVGRVAQDNSSNNNTNNKTNNNDNDNDTTTASLPVFLTSLTGVNDNEEVSLEEEQAPDNTPDHIPEHRCYSLMQD